LTEDKEHLPGQLSSVLYWPPFRQCLVRMDPQVKTTIEQRLLETGEKERLKEHLRNRLIESGWREQLKLHAKEVVEKRGLSNITQEELVRAITPRGRQLVPDVVKKELLVKIQTFLSQQHQM